MAQVIKNLNLKDLVLWTENPRDPISSSSTDQDIADRSISKDGRSIWSLKNLFDKMGKRFDQSEIPTVAYIDNKPIVFDGNRRVLIGKIIHGYVKIQNHDDFTDFEFSEIIPCNVCDMQTALEHVDRKHAENGSWRPLERDIFKHNHIEQNDRKNRNKKSTFLILEDATGLISKNKFLNQRFVKEEIFTPTELHKMGFSTNSGKLETFYENDEDANQVLNTIVDLIERKVITTRQNRGKIVELIDKRHPHLLKKKTSISREFKPDNIKMPDENKKKTRRTKGKQHTLFGDTLSLKAGIVNNLYSDILKLYKEKDRGYSEDFPMIIRMGLRLIVEIAADDDKNKKMDEYILGNWQSAIQKLSQDQKTTLSNQEISKTSISKHLHIGAHGYTASNNLQQTVAMSLVIGKILEISHGK